ncbi:MAG: NADH-quinone oxidoreductase subunit N [candidate division Zixibacteria bacterium]|nr:NADH-quinone oxidoreductase subunit N [candidate division Zixibacteria bacterium]
MDFALPEYDLRLMAPEIFLFLWALLVIAYDVLVKRKSETAVGYLTLTGLMIAGLLLGLTGNGHGFGNMFVSDTTAKFFKMIFLGSAFMAVGSSFSLMREKIVNHRGEFYGLILFSTVGMMFLASSNELLSLYIGLELTTIPLFVLAAFYKDDKLSVEAGIKYFIVGAFSSALMVYGMSFLYGLSGTTDLVQMKINLAITHLSFQDIGVILILSIVLIVAGIGFKLALPPFHQWVPDVYQGSPTPIAAFLSVASKAAGLVAFAKIFANGLYAFHHPVMAPNDWGAMVALIAVAAMILGNTVAIRQTNIKRMLGYSSIAQAGYIMIGIVAMNEFGMASMGFYMFAYMFANMGAFAVVAIIEHKTGSCEIATYSGLSKTSPLMAGTLSVFLLSLAGIPPLAGFLAKFYVFAAGIQAAQADPDLYWVYWLVGVGLLTTVFALYYYANVIKQMYFAKEPSPYTVTFDIPALSVVLIATMGLFLFGLYPEPVLNFASGIARSLGVMM